MEADEVVSLIDSNPSMTLQQIQAVTGVSHGSIWRRLHAAGYSNKRNPWNTDRQLEKSVDTCHILLRKKTVDPFLGVKSGSSTKTFSKKELGP